MTRRFGSAVVDVVDGAGGAALGSGGDALCPPPHAVGPIAITPTSATRRTPPVRNIARRPIFQRVPRTFDSARGLRVRPGFIITSCDSRRGALAIGDMREPEG